MPCHAMQHTCKLNKTAICKSSYAQLEIRMFPPTYIRASVVVRVRSLHTVVRALTACQRMRCEVNKSHNKSHNKSYHKSHLAPLHCVLDTFRRTCSKLARSRSRTLAHSLARKEVPLRGRMLDTYVCMCVCMYVSRRFRPPAIQHSTAQYTHTCTVGERHHTHDACETRHDVRGCGCGCGRGK